MPGRAAAAPVPAVRAPPVPEEPEPAAPVLPAAAPAAAGRTHVVRPGETLGTIASRYYGSPAKWNRIFEANRDRLQNANRVRVGTTLVIPEE